MKKELIYLEDKKLEFPWQEKYIMIQFLHLVPMLEKKMKNCISKYLNGKTSIVVTHELSYLKYMDRIIYMKSGRIEWGGTYDEVQNQPFYDILAKESKEKKDQNHSNDSSFELEKNQNMIKKKEDEKIIKITKEEE